VPEHQSSPAAPAVTVALVAKKPDPWRAGGGHNKRTFAPSLLRRARSLPTRELGGDSAART